MNNNRKDDWHSRTELMLDTGKLEKLKNANVLLVGLGGVGAYAAELIARAGVGNMTIIDGDIIEPSNRNRQLLALKSNEGKSKACIMASRLQDINPELNLTHIYKFLRNEQQIQELLQEPFDYVVDAIDTLSPKVSLIGACINNKLKLVSSMGAGGKLDPAQVTTADISKSYNCRLAKVIRKKLHRKGIYSGFKVVFSPEQVCKSSIEILDLGEADNKRSTTGTISYMPPLFGCLCASLVIRDIINS